MTNRDMTLDGVLVVDKPVGPTSHDVVATARRALHLRRVGHTGTLDPMASGVLPLVLGRATRLAQYLTASDKEYEATLRFGVETDTYDNTGRITREAGNAPSRMQLATALERFRGVIEQTPPPFSAKKIGGTRAYALARHARVVALAPTRVVVHALELVAFEPPCARLRIVCSAGFYVRALAHDVGQAVGTGAILESLVRTRAGAFSLADAVPFSDLAEGTTASLTPRIVPVEGLLLDVAVVTLTPEGVRRASHGQELRPADWAGSPPPASAAAVRLLSPDGRLLGLAQSSALAGFLRPVVVIG